MFMKTIFLLPLIGISSFFSWSSSEITNQASTPDDITVYLFLHEACIISQYYTLPLRELHEKYANEHIQFIGLFPNFSSKPNKIQAFKETYKIPFELQTDYYHRKKDAFGATVTPEVVVYNESQRTTLYQGRIDDVYARVGKRKRMTSTSELKDVLEAIANANPISVSNTTAIGCFIGSSRLNTQTPKK